MKIGWLNKLLGNRGERAAARFLKKAGYKILQRQAKNRIGEIDLIARDRDTIVFVEVKTRSSLSAGHPTEAVGYAKQKQITQTAIVWLKERNLIGHRCRFDVVSIIWHENQEPTIQHYVAAFEAIEN